MTIRPYVRKAQFYETDKMGIIHHANYIRWMEEARCDFMEQIGYTYSQLEQDGLGSPTINVSCQYKAPVHFADTVEILPWVAAFNGIRLTMKYTVTRQGTGQLCSTAETEHCFAREDGKPVSLKRFKPELYQLFTSCIQAAGS